MEQIQEMGLVRSRQERLPPEIRFIEPRRRRQRESSDGSSNSEGGGNRNPRSGRRIATRHGARRGGPNGKICH
jgi:hypothetical protein